MAAPITRRYYARNVVRLGGRRFQGWTLRMLAKRAKQQRETVGKSDGGSARSGLRRPSAEKMKEWRRGSRAFGRWLVAFADVGQHPAHHGHQRRRQERSLDTMIGGER